MKTVTAATAVALDSDGSGTCKLQSSMVGATARDISLASLTADGEFTLDVSAKEAIFGRQSLLLALDQAWMLTCPLQRSNNMHPV